MSDWGPVFVAVVLFILLSPGLLFQLPAKGHLVEFGNFQTSGASIFVHSIIYFALIAIFLLAVDVHVYIAGIDLFGKPVFIVGVFPDASKPVEPPFAVDIITT